MKKIKYQLSFYQDTKNKLTNFYIDVNTNKLTISYFSPEFANELCKKIERLLNHTSELWEFEKKYLKEYEDKS